MLEAYLKSLVAALPGATPREAELMIASWLWLRHCRDRRRAVRN